MPGHPPDRLKELVGTGLEAAWSSVDADGIRAPEWLSEELVRKQAAWIGLPSEAADECVEAARRVTEDPDLLRLAVGTHRVLFEQADVDPAIYGWPRIIRALGEWTGPFYLLLGMSGIPHARAFLEGRGMSEAEARHACRDLYLWAHIHRQRGILVDGTYRQPAETPRYGLGHRNLGWCHRVLLGRTVRLGRFQYIHRPYNRPFRVYRHRQAGAIHLLVENATGITRKGMLAGDDDPTWTSVLIERTHTVTGSPVLDGRVRAEPTTLDLSEWSEVLRPGDPVLEIHIPEDGPMDVRACSDSLVQARDRFPLLFPDRPFKAFGCFSWLLDPQFQRILPPDSNIVQFQERCHLLPLNEGDGRAGLTRIFHTEDLSSAPRDTSMQRAVLKHLESGGGLYYGGAVILAEELPWVSPPAEQ